MARHRKDDHGDPRTHTAVIGDVPTMWMKLVWDITQFDDIQRHYPTVPEPLAFAAINVCISAASLADWTVADFLARRRLEKKLTTEAEVMKHINDHVPQQAMCEAIANTAKHSRLRTDRWPDGVVRLDYDEGDEDVPPGYVFRHIHNGAMESLALNAFDAMRTNWWGELQNLGFAFSANMTDVEWYQQRIRTIFGDRAAV